MWVQFAPAQEVMCGSAGCYAKQFQLDLFLDHLAVIKSSGSGEGILEVVAVEGDGDHVSIEGGDLPVLLVDHLDLDVDRD